MPVQKHTLGDASRPKKYAPLTFMAALLAVFSFAAQASAASVSCAQNGADIDCTYDFSFDPTGSLPGQVMRPYNLNPSGQSYAVLPDTQTGSFTRTGACAAGTEHQNIFLCNDTGFGGNAADGDCDDDEYFSPGDSVQCTAGPAPACGDGNLDGGEECDDGNLSDGDGCSSSCTTETMLAYSPDEANGFLVGSVTGTLNFFWDNVKGVMMVVASIGIVCSLFWWIYRTLKRRR